MLKTTRWHKYCLLLTHNSGAQVCSFIIICRAAISNDVSELIDKSKMILRLFGNGQHDMTVKSPVKSISQHVTFTLLMTILRSSMDASLRRWKPGVQDQTSLRRKLSKDRFIPALARVVEDSGMDFEVLGYFCYSPYKLGIVFKKLKLLQQFFPICEKLKNAAFVKS